MADETEVTHEYEVEITVRIPVKVYKLIAGSRSKSQTPPSASDHTDALTLAIEHLQSTPGCVPIVETKVEYTTTAAFPRQSFSDDLFPSPPEPAEPAEPAESLAEPAKKPASRKHNFTSVEVADNLRGLTVGKVYDTVAVRNFFAKDCGPVPSTTFHNVLKTLCEDGTFERTSRTSFKRLV